MERTELNRLQDLVDREVRARFPGGTVRRVAVLEHGDEPDDLLVRVYIGGATAPEDPQRALDDWAQAHESGMKRLRRELSLRLPPAKMLEFTIPDAGDAAPTVSLPDDPALTEQPLSPHEAVETAVSLLRASYVFPDRAEQAATAIETRLAAGEYDDLDEATLAERLTRQLYDVCADKHLRVRVLPRPLRRERPEPAEPVDPAGCARSAGTRPTTGSSGSSGWTATSATWTSVG